MTPILGVGRRWLSQQDKANDVLGFFLQVSAKDYDVAEEREPESGGYSSGIRFRGTVSSQDTSAQTVLEVKCKFFDSMSNKWCRSRSNKSPDL